MSRVLGFPLRRYKRASSSRRRLRCSSSGAVMMAPIVARPVNFCKARTALPALVNPAGRRQTVDSVVRRTSAPLLVKGPPRPCRTRSLALLLYAAAATSLAVIYLWSADPARRRRARRMVDDADAHHAVLVRGCTELGGRGQVEAGLAGLVVHQPTARPMHERRFIEVVVADGEGVLRLGHDTRRNRSREMHDAVRGIPAERPGCLRTTRWTPEPLRGCGGRVGRSQQHPDENRYGDHRDDPTRRAHSVSPFVSEVWDGPSTCRAASGPSTRPSWNRFCTPYRSIRPRSVYAMVRALNFGSAATPASVWPAASSLTMASSRGFSSMSMLSVRGSRACSHWLKKTSISAWTVDGSLVSNAPLPTSPGFSGTRAVVRSKIISLVGTAGSSRYSAPPLASSSAM